MRSFNVQKLIVGPVLVAAFAALGVSGAMGSTSKKAPLPCKSGQTSTSAAPCTRTWMTAGCTSFLPLIHSVFGASLSVAPKQTKVPGGLACAYTLDGATNAFGFGFSPKGTTAASFQAALSSAPQGWTACQEGTNASTPLAAPMLIPTLGTQAYEYDPCPGASVVSDPTQPTFPDFAEGYVRIRATSYSASGAVTLTQMDTFLRQLIVKYP